MSNENSYYFQLEDNEIVCFSGYNKQDAYDKCLRVHKYIKKSVGSSYNDALETSRQEGNHYYSNYTD